MKRSSKIILASVLTLGIAGGVGAYGKHHFSDPTRFADYMVEKISDELDLTAPQVQSLRGLADELITLKTEMKAEMKTDRQVLQTMIEADTFDQAKALQMVDAKTSAIQNNAPAVVAALGTFLDGLTPEQKAEVAEHIKRHRGRHHRGHHRGHHDDDDSPFSRDN